MVKVVFFLQAATLAFAVKSPLSNIYPSTTDTRNLDSNTPQNISADAATKRSLLATAASLTATSVASMMSNAFLTFSHTGATVSGILVNDSPFFLLYEGCDLRHGHLTDVPGSMRKDQSTTFKAYVKFDPLVWPLKNTPTPEQNVWFKCNYTTQVKTKRNETKNVKVSFQVFIYLDILKYKPEHDVNKLAIEVCEPDSPEGCVNNFEVLAKKNESVTMARRRYDINAGELYSPCNICRSQLNLCARGVMGSGQKTSVKIVIEDFRRHNFNYDEGTIDSLFN